MKKLSILVLIIILAAIVGGGIFLAGWDIPAPQQRVEKVIPNDRFPR